MKRPKREKSPKVRVCITMEESVFIESGQYIDNLSGFINKTIKNYVSRCKELENSQKATNEIDTHNNLLCYRNKKSTYANNNASTYEEPLDDNVKWW